MWAAAGVIACAGACVLIYFGRQARPLWVDEEMLALNARDRSFRELAGGLWLGQAAPLGWLALERASMLTLGLSERAVRALPVFWGLLTLITAVWVGRRWLGSLMMTHRLVEDPSGQSHEPSGGEHRRELVDR